LNIKSGNTDNRNLLEIIPVKNIDWEIQPDSGLVHLKQPKFKSALLRKYLLPLLPDPYFRIKLDEVGTFVWLEIDGKKTTRMIAQATEKKFGERVNPVHDRLGKFIRSLKQSRLIEYQ